MLYEEVVIETVIAAGVVVQSRDFRGVCLVERGHASVEGVQVHPAGDQVVHVGAALRNDKQCGRGEEDVVVHQERPVIHLDEHVLIAVVVEEVADARGPWAIQSSQSPRHVR